MDFDFVIWIFVWEREREREIEFDVYQSKSHLVKWYIKKYIYINNLFSLIICGISRGNKRFSSRWEEEEEDRAKGERESLFFFCQK